MQSKLSKVKAALADGNEREAVRIAAKFRELGEHKAAITRGWAAIQSPAFYESIGESPAALFAAAVAAIRARYGL